MGVCYAHHLHMGVCYTHHLLIWEFITIGSLSTLQIHVLRLLRSRETAISGAFVTGTDAHSAWMTVTEPQVCESIVNTNKRPVIAVMKILKVN